MDIDQWLEDTSAAEGRSLAARLGIPSFLQRANPEAVSPRPKRKRGRPSRDSSLLEDAVEQQAGPPRGQREALQEASGDDCRSEASGHSASTSVSAITSTGPYKRRSRKRTRKDRYDPKSSKVQKQKQTEPDKQRKSKSRKKVRRSKEKHGVSLVHTFHAKNVPRDRLTVRPWRLAKEILG
ncbi:hypothetical protein EV356DRAFT_43657 [Viridothelium virens]|uniref:Uncharacterized protein n=1 Tax=Viridothelium virens TaxID=1048519 RepID=A0A6A6HHT3_VIRVR|nr:hypothetical protein EV356DRAFT_43657 [Viridothelium virens]